MVSSWETNKKSDYILIFLNRYPPHVRIGVNDFVAIIVQSPKNGGEE
jgi:hypothetical protein